MLQEDIEKILFNETEINEIVSNIAKKINTDYFGEELVVVGILKGSVVFLADLFRKINLKYVFLDFMEASSYGNRVVSSGNIKIKKDISCDISGRHILIVEDILDTGNTLSYIKEYLGEKKPASVKICTLLDKPGRRRKPIEADYVGSVVPDLFVVGYGLDYDEKYRNLPYIGILKKEIFSENK